MVELFLGPEGHVFPATAIAVLLGGMLVLAAIDVWKQEIEDVATAALLILAAGALMFDDIQPGQWLSAILTAAVAFGVYLNLGLKGVFGGGDVKLSIVPAFVLGASNPLIGIWWIGCAIVLQQALFFIYRRTQRTPVRASGSAEPLVIPHVPAMAAATLAATAAFPPMW
jgi:Flp pilus assembly protein protease CpaA